LDRVTWIASPACDIVAASARSAFALAEVKWNLVAAVALRLISRLAGAGADVRELARQVAANAPVAVRLTRKAVEIADTLDDTHA